MIIDSHVHIFFEGSDPESFFLGCASLAATFFGRERGEKIDPAQLYTHMKSVLMDKSGEGLLRK